MNVTQNIRKNPQIQLFNKLFPIVFMMICALMFTANEICILLGVI